MNTTNTEFNVTVFTDENLYKGYHFENDPEKVKKLTKQFEGKLAFVPASYAIKRELHKGKNLEQVFAFADRFPNPKTAAHEVNIKKQAKLTYNDMKENPDYVAYYRSTAGRPKMVLRNSDEGKEAIKILAEREQNKKIKPSTSKVKIDSGMYMYMKDAGSKGGAKRYSINDPKAQAEIRRLYTLINPKDNSQDTKEVIMEALTTTQKVMEVEPNIIKQLQKPAAMLEISEEVLATFQEPTKSSGRSKKSSTA